MASSLDELNTLGKQAEERGVKAVVLSQFSSDVARDLASQAETIDANVVLMRGPSDDDGAALVRALAGAAPADIGVLVGEPNPEGPVAATLGETPDAAAAIEMAVRIAKARGVDLRLLDPRRGGKKGRTGPLVKAIERAGVTPSTDGAATATPLVATGIDDDVDADFATIATELGSAVLLCRAKEALAPEGARERLAKLANSRET
jgi:hypothetical protein